MRNVTLAATQMACSWEHDANIAAAEGLIRQAHRRGAQVVLLQELFEFPYFCKDQADQYFALAASIDCNPAIAQMSRLGAGVGDRPSRIGVRARRRPILQLAGPG